jgi:hypothetical protein
VTPAYYSDPVPVNDFVILYHLPAAGIHILHLEAAIVNQSVHPCAIAG